MHLILLAILLVSTLSACANVSRLEKGSLVAFGGLLDDADEPLYYLIRIDIEKSIDARTMSALVKLSREAPPFSLAELTPGIVTRYLPPFIPPPQWPDSWKQKAREDDAYAGGGFNITFKDGVLVYIGICSHCAGGRESPVVGTPDGQQFHALPLMERQITEVFGSPNRIYKVIEVRY
jgi:hypothetical protein